ncbi:MAG: DUF4845 domain-containing protein [Azoarcus sp.]|jgi:hypothetical protein|nr:DUF4845 domain-containing protein [Azoarcus sp.]
MKSRQRGITLLGMIFIAILLGIDLLIAFKAFGPYREYFSLKRIVQVVAEESGGDISEGEVRDKFSRRANIDSVDHVIKPNELVLRKTGGRYAIEAAYTRKVPLVSNISLSFDFKISSQK